MSVADDHRATALDAHAAPLIRIRGLTNWRLPGLQRAIRDGALPSFRALTATSEAQFYGADPGTNYAQARYLLYYLQEHAAEFPGVQIQVKRLNGTGKTKFSCLQ